MTEAIVPAASYVDWIETVQQAAASVQASTEGIWEPIGVVSAAIAGLAFILPILRNVPGWGPIVHTIGQSLINKVAPKRVTEQKRVTSVLAETMGPVMEVIEQLPADNPQVKELKKKISKAAPPEFQAVFAAWSRSFTQEGE